jgi:hypothetical protein
VDEWIDMLFIDRLVAMDSILQFFSFSNVDNSHPLWEYSQYVSPLEEQETKEVLILQDTSQVKARSESVEWRIFLKAETHFCLSHGWKLAWMVLSLMNNIGLHTGRESMSTTTNTRPLNLHILWNLWWVDGAQYWNVLPSFVDATLRLQTGTKVERMSKIGYL